MGSVYCFVIILNFGCYSLFLEERAVDPELAQKINIGFPHLKPARSAQLKERLAHLKAQRSNPELEKASRAKTREYSD